MAERDKQEDGEEKEPKGSFDYSYVPTVARVAVYDDMKMAPRVIEIEPAPTAEYIEKLADVIDEQKRRLGGKIPYSAIREVSENFIHARFTEVVVSVLDGGNTIRFCDQGPGIKDKKKATLPGFTSAIEPMKHYIRGVGSGLPLVKEYLDLSHGKITIEDNMNSGAVVTISLEEHPTASPTTPEGAEESLEQALSQSEGAAAAQPAGNAASTQPAGNVAGAPAEPVQAPVALPQQPAAPAAQQQGAVSSYPAVPYQQPAAQSATAQQVPYQPQQTFAQPSVQQTGASAAPSAPQGAYQAYPVYGYTQAPAAPQAQAQPQPFVQRNVPMPPLSDREATALMIFAHEGALGVTDLSHIQDLPMSSTYNLMDKLEQSGLIEKTAGKKRILTDYGAAVYQQISSFQ